MTLGVTVGGEGVVTTKNGKGQELVTLGATVGGEGVVTTKNGKGKHLVRLGATVDGEGKHLVRLTATKGGGGRGRDHERHGAGPRAAQRAESPPRLLDAVVHTGRLC